MINAAENCAGPCIEECKGAGLIPGEICTGSCTSGCMKKDFVFSDQCSDCFGDGAACAVRKCKLKCAWGSNTPSCKTCLKNYCLNLFVQCSGLDPKVFE